MKKILYFSSTLIMLFCLNFSVQAKNDTSKMEVLVNKIKTEFKELKKIREEILSKIPSKLLVDIKIKREIYAQLSNYFRDNNRYNDYIRTLTTQQKKDFSLYSGLIFKEKCFEVFSNAELVEMMSLLKKQKQKDFQKLYDLFDKVNSGISDSEKTQLKILKEKINTPNSFIDFVVQSGKFNTLALIYSSAIMIIEKPVEAKKGQIKRLMMELYKLNSHELNTSKKNEVEAFYNQAASQLWEPRNEAPRYYYRILLFSECMQSPQKNKAIEKVLRESQLMRKSVIPLIIGNNSDRDVSRLMKKINSELDYDNFDKYWPALQEISKKLPEEMFPGMSKILEKTPADIIQDAQFESQCYLECLFTPSLHLDKEQSD